MKRLLINMLIFVAILAGLLIAGVHVSRAAVGSNSSTTLGTGVWIVNYDEDGTDPNEDETDPNEPEPEPEPEIFLGLVRQVE